jgi:hypothetical protein
MSKSYKDKKRYFEEEDFETETPKYKRKEKGRKKSNIKQIVQDYLDEEPDLIFL